MFSSPVNNVFTLPCENETLRVTDLLTVTALNFFIYPLFVAYCPPLFDGASPPLTVLLACIV